MTRSSANYYGEADDYAEAMSDPAAYLLPDLDDPAEEAAYLAHVEAEHAGHDCDEVHGEEFEPHDCTEEEVEEVTTYPTRSGRITVTGRCVVCHSTRYAYPDSIL